MQHVTTGRKCSRLGLPEGKQVLALLLRAQRHVRALPEAAVGEAPAWGASTASHLPVHTSARYWTLHCPTPPSLLHVRVSACKSGTLADCVHRLSPYPVPSSSLLPCLAHQDTRVLRPSCASSGRPSSAGVASLAQSSVHLIQRHSPGLHSLSHGYKRDARRGWCPSWIHLTRERTC